MTADLAAWASTRPEPSLQIVEVDSDGDAWPRPVAGGCESGVETVLGQPDHGVEHAGPVITVVGELFAGRGVDRGRGRRERQQGGAQRGPVLDASASSDPDPAGPVVGDREEPPLVRDALAPVELCLGPSRATGRVDELPEMPADSVQVGGIEPGGFGQQDPFTSLAQLDRARQAVDRVDHDRRLLRTHDAIAQGGERGRPLGREYDGVVDGSLASTPTKSGDVGEPLPGRGPMQLGPREVAGLDLGEQPRLDCMQVCA